MSKTSEVIKQARRELIQQTLDKICQIRDFSELRRGTYVVLSHLWLHGKAKKENLFEVEEWSNPDCRDELIEKIRKFLVRYIK